MGPKAEATEVSRDTLLGGRVTLIQGARGYRAAIDPVLLAAAVPAKAGERVLDAGAGAGAAALCLAHRVPGCRIMGLELQPEPAALARENAAANGVADRVEVLEGDLLSPPEDIAAGGFDHVMTNPPHLEASQPAPPHPGKRAAHLEGAADLAAWLDFCLRMARPKGRVTLIHRADRIDAILAALHLRAGGVLILPLWPKAGRPAKRVIVSARKGVATPARIGPGLVLHEADGAYTAAADAILRDGAALTF